jgi:Flp pilus assembly protein TadG
MNRFTHGLGKFVRRFSMDQAGVAAVEFALIMPFMILLFFGTVEASRALAYDRRLTSAASALGDLVSQTKTSLTTVELSDYFTAARITMVPYDSANLQQVVTCVYVDEDGAATVSWSYADNGASAHVPGATYALPPEYIAIASDSYVIVSEASLFYRPITNIAFDSGFTLYKEQFYVPRFGNLIQVVPPA